MRMADVSSLVEQVTGWVVDEGRCITAAYLTNCVSIPFATAISVLEAIRDGPHASRIAPLISLSGFTATSGLIPSSSTATRSSSTRTGAPGRATTVATAANLENARRRFATVSSETLYGLAPAALATVPPAAEEGSHAQPAKLLPTAISDAITAEALQQMRELSLSDTVPGEFYRLNKGSSIATAGITIGAPRRRALLSEMAVPSAAPAPGPMAPATSKPVSAPATSATSKQAPPKSSTSSTLAASFFGAAGASKQKSAPAPAAASTSTVDSVTSGGGSIHSEKKNTPPSAVPEKRKGIAPVEDDDEDMGRSAEAAARSAGHSSKKGKMDLDDQREEEDFAQAEGSEEDEDDDEGDVSDSSSRLGDAKKEAGKETIQETSEAAPEKPAKAPRKKRAPGEGPPKKRKAKGDASGTRFSEGVIKFEGPDGEEVVADAGDAEQKGKKEADLLDAFRHVAATAVHRPKKKLVTKTYMDARGYLVTEDVWEEDPDAMQEEVSAPSIARSPSPKRQGSNSTTASSASSHTAPKAASKPTAGKAGAFGAGPGKQLGLATFFKKQ